MDIEIHIFSTFHQHFSFILPHLAAAWGWLCKPSSGYHGISMSKLENTMKHTLNKGQYFFRYWLASLELSETPASSAGFQRRQKTSIIWCLFCLVTTFSLFLQMSSFLDFIKIICICHCICIAGSTKDSWALAYLGGEGHIVPPTAVFRILY